MDFKSREASWQGQINAVFLNNDVASNDTGGLKFDEIFKNIKNLTYKRTRCWWSKAFLENYIQHNLIPRGLHIHVTPSFPVGDEVFIKDWEEVCNSASKKLMELLVKYNSTNLMETDRSLDEVYIKAKACLTTEQIGTLDGQLEKLMDQWIKEIRTNQTSKLHRDQRDFASGKVYKWRRPNLYSGDRDRSASISSNQAPSDVSGASCSASVVTSVASTPKRKREPRYAPAKRSFGYSPGNSNLKVINLSNHVLTDIEIDILQKGLMFCPAAQFNKFTAVKDLHLFARKLMFKKLFHNEGTLQLFPTEAEQEALTILDELAREHNEPVGVIYLPACQFFLVPCHYGICSSGGLDVGVLRMREMILLRVKLDICGKWNMLYAMRVLILYCILYYIYRIS
ncbi:uncharacterized protein [Ranitomeya imitator]|uniref:uncharacterized protein n=1 Tax=Ranitomeya imitator TaxID=111125 RepID=UPI0037E71AF7